MSQEAYTLFADDRAPDGTMIVDEDLVETEGIRSDIHFYAIPATRIAEELGNKIVSNVVMLGAVAALVEYIHRETLLQAVKDSVPERFVELNERAFVAGYEIAKEKLG
jgi:2-oxoglutarate ferredoxin oxidoreductase subunit gamma